MKKKSYIRPRIEKITLDYSISLQMQSEQPTNPELRGGGNDTPSSDPFASPFDDKPFN